MKKPEYRQDPITGRWVVIAADRAHRPIEFRTPAVFDTDRVCPFCVGNEASTPHASLEIVDEESGHWQVRIVPNLYPAFDAFSNDSAFPQTKFSHGTAETKTYRTMPAIGHHEVVIESPRHVRSLTELSEIEVAWAVDAYRQRMETFSREAEISHAMIFKNCGPAAGISLEHVHSQLVALPVISPVVELELHGARAWCESHSQCVFCQMANEADRLTVDSTDEFVAICPFASRFAYEMWILPKRHVFHYHDQEINHGHFAKFLRRTLWRLEQLIPNAAYNLILHTSPFDSNCYDYYHWHIEIIPRIATVAGLEWGSGIHVNVVPPEIAAERLSQIE